MDVAIVGGGVNGVCSGIALAEKGAKVTLYERLIPFAETSSKSSKMLHGGIRYLENIHIRLVKEALADRAWWIENFHEHTIPQRFFIPVYKNKSRNTLKLYFGVKLYEWLAGRYSLGDSQYHGRSETIAMNPSLLPEGLMGSLSYIDVLMDDKSLSRCLLNKAVSLGVKIENHTQVDKVNVDGTIELAGGTVRHYQKVVNACGPWAQQLLIDSNIKSGYDLTLVKGSHIFLNQFITNPIVIQVPTDGRIVFALPVRNQTLIGTTEVIHKISDPIFCTKKEIDYLIALVNSVFSQKVQTDDVISSFAGVRPIVGSRIGFNNLSKANRDSSIEELNNLINVFGGKWTSGMRLGRLVANKIYQK